MHVTTCTCTCMCAGFMTFTASAKIVSEKNYENEKKIHPKNISCPTVYIHPILVQKVITFCMFSVFQRRLRYSGPQALRAQKPSMQGADRIRQLCHHVQEESGESAGRPR